MIAKARHILDDSYWPPRVRVTVLVVGLLLLIVLLALAFDITQVGGTDWRLIRRAAMRVVDPENYATRTVFTDPRYFNPPWYVLTYLPLYVLPVRWGWAAGMVLSSVFAILLLRRWLPEVGIIRPVLVLTSPPMLYIFLHGQIDLLVLGGILLPQDWWFLVATAKPQAAIALVFGVPRSRWVWALAIFAVVLVATILIFGNWAAVFFAENVPFSTGHNLWLGLSPFQMVVGVLCVSLGISRKDERFFVAGSPFFSPYITMGTMIGPWLALVTFLTNRQAAAVYLAWWLAVAYRLVLA